MEQLGKLIKKVSYTDFGDAALTVYYEKLPEIRSVVALCENKPTDEELALAKFRLSDRIDILKKELIAKDEFVCGLLVTDPAKKET
jgi:hypothetical protein